MPEPRVIIKRWLKNYIDENHLSDLFFTILTQSPIKKFTNNFGLVAYIKNFKDMFRFRQGFQHIKIILNEDLTENGIKSIGIYLETGSNDNNDWALLMTDIYENDKYKNIAINETNKIIEEEKKEILIVKKNKIWERISNINNLQELKNLSATEFKIIVPISGEFEKDKQLIYRIFKIYWALSYHWLDNKYDDHKKTKLLVNQFLGIEMADEKVTATSTSNEFYNISKQFNNIILQGPPGTGKTYSAINLVYERIKESLASDTLEFSEFKNREKFQDRWELVQFHPSYSYEDFVMGYLMNEDGKFEVKEKIFTSFCKRAFNNPENEYFLIIDEINRGDISKILGELILGLEYRDMEIKTAYGIPITIPKNLIIIGTMNTADRSIAIIDYALRRRFVFHTLSPDLNKLEKIMIGKEECLVKTTLALFEKCNGLFNGDKDFAVGHTYFISNTKEELIRKMKFQVVPLLEEYKKEGIINNIDEFVKEINQY